MRYLPPTIRQTGLKKHLDLNTKLGYDVFIDAVERGVNVQNLARLYGKDRRTIEKWIKIYREELGAPKKP